MRKMTVKLTLVEEILGTASANPDIHAEFIASKAPDAEKIEEEIARIGVDAEIEKGKTVFPKTDDGRPFCWDYQVRGFFKEACGALRKVPKTLSSKCKAYKKEVDNTIFIEQRMIPFEGDITIGDCQRPLRAQTAQGERISLSNSETIPAGATLTFTVICFVVDDMEMVKEWLDYGRFKGLGQWRNSGKGKFTWELISEDAAADFRG